MSNWVWEPSRAQIEASNVWRFMQRLGFQDLPPFLDWSVAKLETFWDECVRECGTHWYRPYTQVLDESLGPQWSRWFTDGTTNIAANCLDRHEGLAITWESEDGDTRDITFGELRQETNRIASYLLSLGLQQGDRVALVLPMVPGVVAMLYACFKLGLVVVPIFSGFGEHAIWTRLADSGARLVITVETMMRRGRPVAIHSKVAEALRRGTDVQNVVLYAWGTLGTSRDIPTAELPSEATAFILYTSGTTGRPKGVVHTHGGCLAQMTKEIKFSFDHQPGDRFWWLSDIGWMMGPWKIIGNHSLGGTIFLYDGAPDFPDTNRLWRTIERHRITTFGISPTAIRMLMKDSRPEDFDMSTLRLLGSTGEPWDDTSWMWFFERVGGGRAPVINICGGTEIVGSFVNCLPIQPLKPCSLGQASLGIATDIVDEGGQSVRGRMGYLVCKRPCPSMTRGVWNDSERYLSTYWSRFPGWWNHGDWASTDEDGVWYVHGRADESMNVAGRKVGPAEVEEALMEHAAVSEAAVIGVPDDTKGEGIVAFVVVNAPVEAADLAAHLVKTMGPTFRPNAIEIVPELPKTQSGKIVRRLIRQRYLGEALGDASTVANAAALEAIRKSSG